MYNYSKITDHRYFMFDKYSVFIKGSRTFHMYIVYQRIDITSHKNLNYLLFLVHNSFIIFYLYFIKVEVGQISWKSDNNDKDKYKKKQFLFVNKITFNIYHETQKY